MHPKILVILSSAAFSLKSNVDEIIKNKFPQGEYHSILYEGKRTPEDQLEFLSKQNISDYDYVFVDTSADIPFIVAELSKNLYASPEALGYEPPQLELLYLVPSDQLFVSKYDVMSIN